MSSVIKIVHAPKLRFLGFLVPGMHKLEIGNTVIKVGIIILVSLYSRCGFHSEFL